MSFKHLFPFLLAVVFLGTEPPDGCQSQEGVPCGDQTCEPGQYCSILYPGVYGAEPMYTCEVPPEACEGDQLNCDCLVASGACVDEMYGACGDSDLGPTCSFFAP